LKHSVYFYEYRSVHEIITKNTAQRVGGAMLTVAPHRYNLSAY